MKILHANHSHRKLHVAYAVIFLDNEMSGGTKLIASVILCNIFSYLEGFDVQQTVVRVSKCWYRDYQTKMGLRHNLLIDIDKLTPNVLIPHLLAQPTRLHISTNQSSSYEPILYRDVLDTLQKVKAQIQ